MSEIFGWEVMIWSEKWTDKGDVLLWCRLLQREQLGTKRVWQNAVLEDGRVPAKEARNWKSEGQEESREWSIKGSKISLKWKVSWRKTDCGIGKEEHCRRKRVSSLESFWL